VDVTGNVGSFSSIEVIGSGAVGISYYDATNGDLKYATSTDVVAPATVNLNVSGGCYDHVYLDWTAPGDDGDVGTATEYALVWSSAPITEANFGSANGISIPAPKPAGSAELDTVYVPWCSSGRYYALKTRDDASNWSFVSNCGFIAPACPQPPNFCEDASSHQVVDEELSGKPHAGMPARLELAAPQPSPGRTLSRVRYAVPMSAAGQEYDLSVFDLFGRRVATLERGRATVGFHDVSWGLTTSNGEPVRNGVYFLRLRLGSENLARRIVTLR
jgi:hypothetical protein